MNEVMSSTIVAIVSTLMSVVSALFAWFLARRKNNADAKMAEANATSVEIDNEDKKVTVYQKIVDDLTQRLERAIAVNNDRDVTIDNLIKANKDRDKQIEHLIGEVEKLTGELKKYEQLNGKTEP